MEGIPSALKSDELLNGAAPPGQSPIKYHIMLWSSSAIMSWKIVQIFFVPNQNVRLAGAVCHCKDNNQNCDILFPSLAIRQEKSIKEKDPKNFYMSSAKVTMEIKKDKIILK